MDKLRRYVKRKEAACVTSFILSLALLLLILVFDWKQTYGGLRVTIVTETSGCPIDVKIHLPSDYDLRGSIARNTVESILIETSSGEILMSGTSSDNIIVVDIEKIALLKPTPSVMEEQLIEVMAVGNVTIFCRFFVLSETNVGEITSYSMVYAANYIDGVANPIFDKYCNERIRVWDCAICFSFGVSILVSMISSRVFGISWAERLPVVTCSLTCIMFGLYVFTGTGLDILMKDNFSTSNVLVVLSLGSLLHTSFSHLFNNFFLGFLPAGIAFESGLRWKSQSLKVKLYLISFFLVNLLITAISYPMHGIPPMGSSYPVISLATVFVSIIFIFRDRIVLDSAEKRAYARLVALCAFGSYPLIRGVYDWLGYMIEYPTNWSVIGEGASHLLVFLFTLFIIFSAREHLAKQELVIGI
ncbi:MAG: hypothetical protein ACUVTL_04500 [Thermoproteota archaeon]